jgi:biopolymer transport protein ExbD
MSAQFVEVYEIGSSLPMVKNVEEDKKQKDPLNLTVEVSNQKIIVKTGLKTPKSLEFNSNQLDEVRSHLSKLKGMNPEENTIILKVDSSISFQKLISFIDVTQKDKSGKIKLFEKIVFQNEGAI